jgi:hypothetical protein
MYTITWYALDTQGVSNEWKFVLSSHFCCLAVSLDLCSIDGSNKMVCVGFKIQRRSGEKGSDARYLTKKALHEKVISIFMLICMKNA